MADALVGTYKGDETCSTGMREFAEFLGQGELFDKHKKPYTIVITKTGDNKYIREVTSEGIAAIKEVMAIGETIKQVGFVGEVDVTYSMDGNKVLSKSIFKGTEVTGARYLDGNVLVEEINAGSIHTVTRTPRA